MGLKFVVDSTLLVGLLATITMLPGTTNARPNIALRKPAWQSSLATNDAWLNPGLAVDGKGNWLWSERSCTATKAGKNQWWAVDLGQPSTIVAVKILSRRDCCSGYLANVVVGLTNNPPNVTPPTVSNVQICGRGPALVELGRTIAVVCPRGLPQARYVVLISSTALLTMCEVKVYAPDPDWSNLALGKSALQSTVLAGGTASAAVDGNRNSLWNAGSCTSTIATDLHPWWAVDLGQHSVVDVVAVTARTDACCAKYLNNYIVGVTNTDPHMTAPTIQTVKECGRGPAVATPGHITAIACTATTPPARYVVILRAVAFLSMCEVEVYGRATDWSNLALRKLTWQVSLSPKSVPGAAVDGNRNPLWSGGSCTATAGTEKNPWWAVDLGQLSDVFVVSLLSRGDCCAASLFNAIVGLTNKPPNVVAPQVSNVNVCGRAPATVPLGKATAVNCEAGLPASRYVAVIGTTTMLTMCEVEVFGQVAVVDPCATNPCKNGGLCSAQQDNSYLCACKAGWTGSDCTSEVNVCAKGNPCKNGGTCVKFGNTYECRCTPNWAGTNCEMGAAACKAVPATQRINCGWGGVTPAQCNERSCCFDSSIIDRPACFYSSYSCDTIQEEERADCGWDGITYNQCINRGCCFNDDESNMGPVCYRKANPACVGVDAENREVRGASTIQPNECTAQGWCYDSSIPQEEGPWCFVVKA